ncbi:Ig-like virion protein [Oenococcus phage vB_OeS_unk162]|nr:Ig-like virion protein [Oenococcus phage vB_OeS_unk162]
MSQFKNEYSDGFYAGDDNTKLYKAAGGIATATAANTDTNTTYSYMDEGGGAESDLTQKEMAFTLAGNRKAGDPFQEWVRSKLATMDNDCYFIQIEPDGSQIEGTAKISAITHGGGDANARQTFSVTLTWDNIPADFNPDGSQQNISQVGTVDETDVASVLQSSFTRGNAIVAVTGITVAPSTVSVKVGATSSLTATLAPATATNKDVIWVSSNTAVATVSNAGVVTGVATGTATITAAAVGDSTKTATSVVTVTAAA